MVNHCDIYIYMVICYGFTWDRNMCITLYNCNHKLVCFPIFGRVTI